MLIRSTTKLVRFYEGCTGLKTGTTSRAGSCLSATADKNGMQLVAVVMNAPTSDDRFNGARKLLDYGYANWSRVKIEMEDEELTAVKVLHGLDAAVGIKPVTLDSVLVPRGKEKEVVKKVEMVPDVAAPVVEDQIVGKITLSLDGKVVGEMPLLAERAVPKMTLGRAFSRLMGALFKL